MKTAFSRIFSLWSKQPAFLSGGEDDNTRHKVIVLNIKRERVLTSVLIAFLIIIMTCIQLAEEIPSINKYISSNSIQIHIVLIILAILFLVLTRSKEKMQKEEYGKLYLLHLLIITIVMFSCALIAINNEIANQRPFAYIIAMYTIASLVLLSKKERLLIYFISYGVYLGGSLYRLGLSGQVLGIVIYTLPLLVLALIVSNINYSVFFKNIMYQKLIEQKNQQLSDMYKTSEENLRLRTEQLSYAMELDKLKASFFSNISHELRTPLNIINSAEQMLRLILNNEDIQPKRMEIIKYNEMVQQNCYRLIRLIENLIDVTEIDAGQAYIKLGCYDIVRLVESVTIAASEYVKDKNISLEFSSSLDHMIMICDSEKIERIMLNLLSNAVKFTPENGKVEVRLKGCRKKIVISVRDTGIGIPESMKKTVFDPFVQVDQSISRKREGSGIGLTIVKAFVEMHRGSIYVLSEEGQGSEFVIELPADLSKCTEEVVKLTSNFRFNEKIKMEFSDYYN